MSTFRASHTADPQLVIGFGNVADRAILSPADVELATAECLDRFSNRRLHTAIGGILPAEDEAAYYAQTQPDPEAGPSNRSLHETRCASAAPGTNDPLWPGLRP
jgi:hypothetical protein